MTPNLLSQTEKSQETKAHSSLKLMTFSIGKLNLGLGINAVYKVVNLPSVHSSGLNPVGVTHVDDRHITVVDLHQRLFHTSPTCDQSTNSYLILLQSTTGEFVGIPVTETPTLLDVPLSLIRPLPDSYRKADTLSIASHIAIVPLPHGGSYTLFLLDIDFLQL